ncbi:hypothetical protein B0H10DRAFT_2166716 [Mycena sp. CBHHK59/15]|nr:hypothetical protein B0H10DRAFT_2166716 [Mycena sp. CBHHK59/15]
MGFNTHVEHSLNVRATAQLAENLEAYLNDGDIDHDSDDDAEERTDSGSVESDDSPPHVTSRKTHKVDPNSLNTEWFPWPDKETCVLNILRHVPWCSFSRKQNAAIHWAMLALGLKDLPSDRVMDDIDKSLQKMCGVQSIRYSGKLGHVYYVNDLAAIIAQEMANTSVRKNLHFIPEDTKPSLSQAWQASRWLKELDSDLTTPMIREHNQDFYINEPTVLSNGAVCMPTRWFKRNGKIFARAWKMHWASETLVGHGCIVEGDQEFDIDSTQLLVSFPLLVTSHISRRVPDPRIIHVVAFPIWLYCNDTSGNTSKKWNKHNSFLFTTAGLPRQYVHRESNIHFLSTSNIAPPLEMLDGIVDQLQACQERGIWAWDCEYRELVLVIPSVLAMLGDNPMQSEFACHIGFRGKFFCCVCWTMRTMGMTPVMPLLECPTQVGKKTGSSGKSKKKKTKKKDESISDMISRVGQFMSASTPTARPRFRLESCQELQAQFKTAIVVGGKAGFKRRKTQSGIKDTFQGVFLDRIFDISTKRGCTKLQKQADITALHRTFPQDITSPVWHIKDFDPHQDTPVEILHVILLGFVKYFWQDAVARIKESDKDVLICCLSSFNVRGLGISPLPGHTLVNYSGSLTGWDFRTIVQAAPFVLQGLLPPAYIELWTALSAVVTLVWQPHIVDLDKHTKQLDAAIKHFLDCTCGLTLQWFNKPKFHVILHLPSHIRRFGPAMLFATEGFESFNTIIRSCSVHSNRYAPSHDISARMGKGNRIHHPLSGGFLPVNGDFKASSERQSSSPWMDTTLAQLKEYTWAQASDSSRRLTELNSFGARLLGWDTTESTTVQEGGCLSPGQPKMWTETQSSRAHIPTPMDVRHIHPTQMKVYTPKSITLGNGDICSAGDWVIWDEIIGQTLHNRIGQVVEIVQVIDSPAYQARKADFVLVMRSIVQPVPTEHQSVRAQNIQCTVNVQHNCADNKCRTTRTRVVLAEREKTSQRELAVEHITGSDLIVNVGQMRDAATLDPFRFTPNALITADIIRSSAEQSFADRQKQKKMRRPELKTPKILNREFVLYICTPPSY